MAARKAAAAHEPPAPAPEEPAEEAPYVAPPAPGFVRITHPDIGAADVGEPSLDIYLARGWALQDPDTTSAPADPTPSQED